MATNTNQPVTGWVGWVYFAGFMLMISGFFQMLVGLTGLLNNNYFASVNGHLLIWNYHTYGWIELLFGLLVLLTGMSLFSGSSWARVVATVLVAFNLMAQFAFVSVYPIWSVIMMVINIFVIYALTVHGGEARLDR
jgi:hypothetical protein